MGAWGVKTQRLKLKIENEKEQLDYKLDAHLRRCGWDYTSSTVPGCYWLWEKTLANGKTVCVGRDAALGIQSWIDEYGEDR